LIPKPTRFIVWFANRPGYMAAIHVDLASGSVIVTKPSFWR
jgi:hypothetical protein